MQAIIEYPDGRKVEALVLSITPFGMRIVIPDNADTVELKLAYGQWTDSEGAPVSIAALLAGNEDSGRVLRMPETSTPNS